MNARIRILAMASCITVLGATPLFASSRTPRIDHREARQEQRIERGVATGALTIPEARFLERQQASIRAEEMRAKVNGFVSPRERIRLRHDLRVAHRDIARLSRNASRRG